MESMDGISKLQNLILISKQVEYVAPTILEEEWEMFDVIFAAMNIALNNSIQMRACLILARKFTFFRMISSSLLKKYIKRYSEGIKPSSSDLDTI